jgi:hypothetical protein
MLGLYILHFISEYFILRTRLVLDLHKQSCFRLLLIPIQWDIQDFFEFLFIMLFKTSISFILMYQDSTLNNSSVGL